MTVNLSTRLGLKIENDMRFSEDISLSLMMEGLPLFLHCQIFHENDELKQSCWCLELPRCLETLFLFS